MTAADALTKQIESSVSQLREVGWCVVERVIPENEVDAIRQHVEAAHLEATAEYEAAGGALGRQTDKDGGSWEKRHRLYSAVGALLGGETGAWRNQDNAGPACADRTN